MWYKSYSGLISIIISMNIKHPLINKNKKLLKKNSG